MSKITDLLKVILRVLFSIFSVVAFIAMPIGVFLGGARLFDLFNTHHQYFRAALAATMMLVLWLIWGVIFIKMTNCSCDSCRRS